MLLREVTREHMALLVAATQRPTDRAALLAAAAGGAGASGKRGAGALDGQVRVATVLAVVWGSGAASKHRPGRFLSDIERSSGGAVVVVQGGGADGGNVFNGAKRQSGARTSSHGSGSLAPGLAASGGDSAAGGAEGTPFGALQAHRPDLAQVFVSTAISALCWPDMDSVAKAAAVCR